MSEITKHESMEEFYARTKAEEESAHREALRDHFAGLALQGLLANGAVIALSATRHGGWGLQYGNKRHLADYAYALADAMLITRESKP